VLLVYDLEVEVALRAFCLKSIWPFMFLHSRNRFDVEVCSLKTHISCLKPF